MHHHKLCKLLETFVLAWNTKDIDTLMGCMTAQPIFFSAAGSVNEKYGKCFKGKANVRKAYIAIWEAYPDAKWNEAKHLIQGDRGISEWLFTATNKQGKQIEVQGVDVFTFHNGKIAVKNTFRKQLS